MKIAFLTFNYLPQIGGAQIFLHNLALSLCERGYLIDIYVPFSLFQKSRQLSLPKGIRIRPIFFWEEYLTRYFPVILKTVLWIKQKFENYHLWQVIGSFPAGYLSTGLPPRTVRLLRCYGEDIQKNPEIQYGLRLNSSTENKIKYTLQKMTHLVALTASVVSCYHELGIVDEKITVIPNGVDIDRFQNKDSRNTFRSNNNIPSESVCLLTVGRYHIKKGFEYIPGILAKLLKTQLNIIWILVGRQSEKIYSIAEKKGVLSNIRFIHEIETDKRNDFKKLIQVPSKELIEIYQAADIFVFPSLVETFGMVLIEALAAGLPVITTDAPGCRDVIHHLKNGILVPPGDEIRMAGAIRQILDDPQLAAQLHKGAQNSLSRYTWQQVSQEYENLYKKLISK